MLKQEVLDAISTVYNEQAVVIDDVSMAMLDYYQKQQTLMEAYDEIPEYMDGYVQEAADDSGQSKNFIQKIWAGIKKFFKMLAEQFGRLIGKVKDLWENRSSKRPVSGDSIVLRVLSKSSYNKPDDTREWKIPKVNPKYTNGKADSDEKDDTSEDDKDSVVKESAYMEAATDTKYVTIEVPVGKGSTFYPKKLKVPKSDIITEINDDNKTISFHITGFGKWNQTTASGETNTSPTTLEGTKKPWTHSSRISLYLISEPEVFNKFILLVENAIKFLSDNKKKHSHEFNSKCKKIIDDMNRGAKRKKLDKVTVSLKDLTDFQQKVNTLNYQLDKFTDISTDVSDLGKDTIKSFNSISKALLDIQVSMNLLSSSLNANPIVNECFIGCIKNLTLLDQFVAAMIDAGVPPKYIAYNTWLVADECIRGKGETYKPIWGQTRFIFFPPDKRFVYKIAMSGAGITSNRAEARTSDMFVKMDRVDLIAPVVKTWTKETIVAMERVDNDVAPSYAEILSYTKNANDAIVEYEKTHNINLNIKIADQHKDNVKYDKVNKCFRSIDYGIANRAYVKKK